MKIKELYKYGIRELHDSIEESSLKICYFVIF